MGGENVLREFGAFKGFKSVRVDSRNSRPHLRSRIRVHRYASEVEPCRRSALSETNIETNRLVCNLALPLAKPEIILSKDLSYGTATWRRSTQLHGGNHGRPHRLSSMAGQWLGNPVLTSGRLHAGLHNRTGRRRQN